MTRCIEVYYVDTKQKALASVHDILMATADWRPTQLWTDGDFHYGCDSSLQRLEEEFPDIFLRIHRSTLVNRQCIEKMDQDTSKENGLSIFAEWNSPVLFHVASWQPSKAH